MFLLAIRFWIGIITSLVLISFLIDQHNLFIGTISLDVTTTTTCMSLFWAVELEEPAALVAGCTGFLALETIESDLDETFPQSLAVGLCVASTLGAFRGVK
jgi:hypothetical protein